MIVDLKQQTVVITTIDEMKKVTADLDGQTLGLIPTMGYLHEGHMSLVKQSIKTCDYTVVSIFVNPRQFSPNEDLDIYPHDLPRDLEKLGAAGVNALFHPEKEMIYPEGFKTNIEVETITDQLCGKSRPDLFKGVATIIVKLFNIIRPQHAFLGEKDWQ